MYFTSEENRDISDVLATSEHVQTSRVFWRLQ